MTLHNHKEWLDSLKVGDEVAILEGSYGVTIAHVSSRTPTGWIRVGNEEFNSDGSIRGKDAHKGLYPVTEKHHRVVILRRIHNAIDRRVLEKLSLDQLQRISIIINE